MTTLGSMLVLVVGIIITAGEYRTAVATETFLTTPDRVAVLTAKLGFAALVGLVTGFISAATALAVAVALYRVEGVTYPFDDAETWLILGGAICYAVAFGILGATLGAITRNQIVAILAALAWLLIIENILVGISEPLAQWLPGVAGQAIVRAPDRDLLPPAGALALLATYAALASAMGLHVTRTRDA